MNTEYAAKNERIVNAICSRQPYWLLEADDSYYSLVQVGSDRIPLPILTELVGVIPYDPEITLPRDTEIKPLRESLLTDVVKLMMESQKDVNNPGWWRLTDNGTIHICTRPSTDDRYSCNGGNYSYWRNFMITAAGVLAKDDWSCDIQECYPATALYRIDVDSLEPIYNRAVIIVKSIQSGEKAPACPCCGSEIQL